MWCSLLIKNYKTQKKQQFSTSIICKYFLSIRIQVFNNLRRDPSTQPKESAETEKNAGRKPKGSEPIILKKFLRKTVRDHRKNLDTPQRLKLQKSNKTL